MASEKLFVANHLKSEICEELMKKEKNVILDSIRKYDMIDFSFFKCCKILGCLMYNIFSILFGTELYGKLEQFICQSKYNLTCWKMQA